MIDGGGEASVFRANALANLPNATSHVLARGNDFQMSNVDAGSVAAEVVYVATLRGPLAVREKPCDAMRADRSSCAVCYGSGTHPTVTVGVLASAPQPALTRSANRDFGPEPIGDRLRGGAFGHDAIVAKTTGKAGQ